jgi:hypothetical protein
MGIVQEVFSFVKKNLSGAQRRKDAASGERVRGKDAGSVPASLHKNPSANSAPDFGENFRIADNAGVILNRARP